MSRLKKSDMMLEPPAHDTPYTGEKHMWGWRQVVAPPRAPGAAKTARGEAADAARPRLNVLSFNVLALRLTRTITGRPTR